jgi:hypothetical protein
MADLDDLGYTSILDMNNDEAIDILRQLRLSRRIPEKKVTTRETTKQTRTKATNAVNAEMAAELLKILEEM